MKAGKMDIDILTREKEEEGQIRDAREILIFRGSSGVGPK